MICIEIEKHNQDYSIVRLSDQDGWFTSYCGIGLSAFRMLLEDHDIYINPEIDR
jgi:hypothetical protein